MSKDHENEKDKYNFFSYSSLEELRKRMLDLSRRNVLINYKHPAKSLRVVANDLDNISKLLLENHSLKLRAIPLPDTKELEAIEKFIVIDNNTDEKSIRKPTPKEWARHLGIKTDYDLKDYKTTEEINDIQVLLYPNSLDSKARTIRSAAKSSIEEMGANTLFMSLGFLEWFEDDSSDVANLSPLFNIPISIERKSDKKLGSVYSIHMNDEELQTNLTLKQKLLNEFDLLLPEIEENISPSAYLKQVEEGINRVKKKWSVKHYASIALLNFSKQAMYRDLDPNNWPENAIESHPVLSKLFGNSNNHEVGYTDDDQEYAIDEIESIHDKFPLVYDADSSQHSALIDAVGGKNLVIEGPPGSGKSQTITNLIASAINSNKRVLFVAEKMAALNVVKSKLDHIGLGNFCLELHSHKANKLKILQDLSNQLESFNSYKSPKNFETSINRYEGYKQQLNEYVSLINTTWGNTGWTIYEILNRATLLSHELGLSRNDINYQGVDTASIDDSIIHNALEDAAIFQREYAKVIAQTSNKSIDTHAWYGVKKDDYMDYEVQQLLGSLQSWQHKLTELYERWSSLANRLQLETDNVAVMDETLAFITQLPTISETIKFNKLPQILTHLNKVEQFLEDSVVIQKSYEQLLTTFPRGISLESSDVDIFDQNIQNLSSLITSEKMENSSLKIEDLSNESIRVHELLTRIEAVKQILNTIGKQLPSGIQPFINTSSDGFYELGILVELIDSLPNELWHYRSNVYDSASLDVVLPQLTEVFVEIDPLHNELSEVFDLTKLPEANILKQHKVIIEQGGLFKWFSSQWRASKNYILSLSPLPAVKLSQLAPKIDPLIAYIELINKAKSISDSNPVMQQQFEGADTPIARAVALRKWYKKVRQEYGSNFDKRASIGSSLLTMDQKLAFDLKDAYHNNLKHEISVIKQDISSLQSTFSTFFNQSNDPLQASISKDSAISDINLFAQNLDKIVGFIQRLNIDNKTSLCSIKDANKNLHNLLTSQKKTLQSLDKFTFLQEDFASAISNFDISEKILDSYEQMIVIAKALSNNLTVLNYLKSNPTVATYQSLLQQANQVNELYLEYEHIEKEFYKNNHIYKADWTQHTENCLPKLIERNKLALNNPNNLTDWQLLLRAEKELLDRGFFDIISLLYTGAINVEQVKDSVEFCLCSELSQDILTSEKNIREFSSSKHVSISEKFCEYDKKILELQRTQIAANASQVTVPQGNSSGLVSTLSEASLIRHEFGKKTRHIAIRELLDRSANAVQALMPCFMMSPMSVAQYLKPDKFEFDLVVMDEASQIFPEDAIGAIARGKSIVIVGDPKQLPPSNFFKTMSNTNDDDDDSNEVQETTILEESESILDAVNPIFTTRKLKWHYRSRHESLIAFSNAHFYDSKLILFPSPYSESKEFGIRYHYVKGTFFQGVNTLEAQKSIDLLADLIKSNQQESVGIVAMNSRQRDQIEALLEVKLKQDPEFNSAFEQYENKLEPVFIKNLENVQGDERDVIIILMTYGPENIDGRVAQRFGPINQQGGWRRLNVLFTRSRKRMHILSSMQSSDILSRTDSKGVSALKSFLEYCEKGHLHNTQITGKQPDSDFEISVMKKLKERGFNCEPQVGVAGFFIDLAVKNPKRPEEFIMGIECDGATYHSARSARDRDRLRQEILEGLGWNIERIWSTDWFRNPDDQIRRITQMLNSIIEKQNDYNHINSMMPDNEIKEPNVTATISEIDIENNIDQISEDKTEIEFEQVPKDVSDKSLRAKLLALRKQSEEDNPNLAEDKRLLRDDMLDALLVETPCSVEEFKEFIPFNLRDATSLEERGYLEKVLEIIKEYYS